MTDEAYRTEHFGLDERTAQSARDVMDILVGNALAISALDLDTGELRLIKRGIELPQIEADKPMLFSTFNNLLIAQKLIHPEDGDGYLRGTALSALRTVFFGGEKQVYLRYRQKVDGEYRWVALAQYAEEVVADAWRGSFDPLLDLPGVIRRVEREGMVCATFRRRDGAWIRLQVMRYLPDEDEGGGTLWIFSAADADEQRA